MVAIDPAGTRKRQTTDETAARIADETGQKIRAIFARIAGDHPAAGDVQVEIPAALRRIVAGAVYEAAAHLDVKANRARAGTRQRGECAAQAAALREIAGDIAP